MTLNISSSRSTPAIFRPMTRMAEEIAHARVGPRLADVVAERAEEADARPQQRHKRYDTDRRLQSQHLVEGRRPAAGWGAGKMSASKIRSWL